MSEKPFPRNTRIIVSGLHGKVIAAFGNYCSILFDAGNTAVVHIKRIKSVSEEDT